VRAAVISDVHANLAALEAVLDAIDADAVDELWCLGDLVGYNAQPRECIDLVLGRAAVCLAGNHDLVVNGAEDLRVFTHDAGKAARWTRDTLPEESLERLRQLEPCGAREGVELYHASPRDPVWEYVVDDHSAAQNLDLQGTPIALIGHSHVPLMWVRRPGDTAGGGYAEPGLVDLPDEHVLINPGSVGQPRDGDPRAAYLVLDLDAGTADWRRVGYDVALTQAAIMAAGLPRSLAMRLATGR